MNLRTKGGRLGGLVLAGIVALGIGITPTVAGAAGVTPVASASAHNSVLTGVKQCDTTTGTWTVTWTYNATNVPANAEAEVKIITTQPAGSTLSAAAGVGYLKGGQLFLSTWTQHLANFPAGAVPVKTGNWSASFTQTGIPGNATSAKLQVQGDWTDGYSDNDPWGEVKLTGNCQPDEKKVQICHRDQGNPEWKQIEIAESALDAHLHHQWGEDIYPVPDGGCPQIESVTPEASYTTAYCDSSDWTIKGVNNAVMVAHPGVVWTATKGGDSASLPIGEGYDGPPLNGFGTYTVTGSDGDPSDLYEVVETEFTMTFADPSTITCAPPDIPTQTVTHADHSCTALGTITLPTIGGVGYEVDFGNGPLTFSGGTIYATDDGTLTGDPVFGLVTIDAVKTGSANLSGTTHWEYTFHEPPCLVEATFTANTAQCVAPGVASENGAVLTASAGVTFTYELNGVPGPGPIAAGTYGNADITPGDYVVTAHAPAGVFYAFSNGLTTLTFPAVSFPDVNTLDCTVTITEQTPEPSAEDFCAVKDDRVKNLPVETDLYKVDIDDKRVNGVGDYVITLVEKYGHKFDPSLTTSWILKFTNAACPPILAMTGMTEASFGTTVGLGVGALVAVLLGLVFVVPPLRRRAFGLVHRLTTSS